MDRPKLDAAAIREATKPIMEKMSDAELDNLIYGLQEDLAEIIYHISPPQTPFLFCMTGLRDFRRRGRSMRQRRKALMRAPHAHKKRISTTLHEWK